MQTKDIFYGSIPYPMGYRDIVIGNYIESVKTKYEKDKINYIDYMPAFSLDIEHELFNTIYYKLDDEVEGLIEEIEFRLSNEDSYQILKEKLLYAFSNFEHQIDDKDEKIIYFSNINGVNLILNNHSLFLKNKEVLSRAKSKFFYEENKDLILFEKGSFYPKGYDSVKIGDGFETLRVIFKENKTEIDLNTDYSSKLVKVYINHPIFSYISYCFNRLYDDEIVTKIEFHYKHYNKIKKIASCSILIDRAFGAFGSHFVTKEGQKDGGTCQEVAFKDINGVDMEIGEYKISITNQPYLLSLLKKKLFATEIISPSHPPYPKEFDKIRVGDLVDKIYDIYDGKIIKEGQNRNLITSDSNFFYNICYYYPKIGDKRYVDRILFFYGNNYKFLDDESVNKIFYQFLIDRYCVKFAKNNCFKETGLDSKISYEFINEVGTEFDIDENSLSITNRFSLEKKIKKHLEEALKEGVFSENTVPYLKSYNDLYLGMKSSSVEQYFSDKENFLIYWKSDETLSINLENELFDEIIMSFEKKNGHNILCKMVFFFNSLVDDVVRESIKSQAIDKFGFYEYFNKEKCCKSETIFTDIKGVKMMINGESIVFFASN